MGKRTLIGVLVVFFAVCSSVFGAYGGGSGIEGDPYLIYDANQLNAIGANSLDWNKHFKLMADIDMSAFSGTQFNIIGRDDVYPSQGWKPFEGVFDGNGKRILNFSYSVAGGLITGLFGTIGNYGTGQPGVIRDLGFVDVNIDGGSGNYVGALAGLVNAGSISGCFVEGGTVRGQGDVGGLVGDNRYGSISRCYTTCDVLATRAGIGGLVGVNGQAITACYATGRVSGQFQIGGLAGGNYGVIENCYSTGDVAAEINDLGGLVGLNVSPGSMIVDCYSAGHISGPPLAAGGLVGRNIINAVIQNCFWDVETSGLDVMCEQQDLGGQENNRTTENRQPTKEEVKR